MGKESAAPFFDDQGNPQVLDTAKQPVSLAALTGHPELDKSREQGYLKELTIQLTLLHQAYIQQGLRAILVFEGTDAAGKGGIIRRMYRGMNPHFAHVWPIAAPRYKERDQHYLYRFWVRLPLNGEIAVFDRSWYGRVLVERVEGLASRQEWQRAYREINDFESMLYDDGVRIVKFFMHITREEQESRFFDRLQHPHKRWKLTAGDFESQRYWDDYQLAFQDMLEQTSTAHSPWHVVPADSKPFARVAVYRRVISALAEGVDTSQVRKLAPAVRKAAEAAYGEKRVAAALVD